MRSHVVGDDIIWKFPGEHMAGITGCCGKLSKFSEDFYQVLNDC